MICSQCGAEIIDPKLPCPECGHKITEQEGMDKIIKDILDEDDYKPKFEEGASEGPKKEDNNKANISTIFSNGSKTSKEAKAVKTSSSVKTTTKPSGKTTGFTPKKTIQKPMNGSVKKTNKVVKPKLADKVVMILRYMLSAVIVLFLISLFFNWFTLKENAVNYGMERTEKVKTFMYPGLENYTEEELGAFLKTSDVPIVTFSGLDLYRFGRDATEPYLTIKGPTGTDNRSIVAMIHKYYMLGMIIPLIISAISLLLVLIFKSLRGIGTVRNLSVVNFMVVGLNYLALRVPYFSMFAVKSKDNIGSALDLKPSEISMTMEGVAAKSLDSFYSYEFYQERGFMFAIIMLGLWLFLGIVLTEVKHRKDEIAIENGDIK